MGRAGSRPAGHRHAGGPTAALRALGIDGAVRRAMGGNTNMHWLVDAGGERAVLRRYGPWRTSAEVLWELELQRRLAVDGWRVPTPLTAPIEVGGHVWVAGSWVPGRRRRPRTDATRIDEQRRRGRVLGELHLAMQDHLDLGARPGWSRIDGWLDTPDEGRTIDEVLNDPAVVTPSAREVFQDLHG